MFDKRKCSFLWILIGIGTLAFTSCGRRFASDSESVGVSDIKSVGSGAAAGMTSDIAETDAAESGTGKSSKTESSTAEGDTDTGKSSKAESDSAEDDTGKSSKVESGTVESDTGKDSAEGRNAGETGTDAASLQRLPGGTESGTEQKESESAGTGEDAPREIPQLPETAGELAGFVPEGWEILDSVELDFNEDGIPDYVGVLEAVPTDAEDAWYPEEPRILFAAAGDGTKGYRLDFQDINLIRTRAEGGVFGDPYEPLTAEGKSFTTHAYGGSAWRWSEDYTYTYMEGVWRLTASEAIYGYGGYITSYSRDDWESGTGIRKERSSEFSDMEKNWESGEDWDSAAYDLEYEIPLDEPVALEQAGKRWWLASDRVTAWAVESVTCAAGAELAEEKIKRPDEAYLEYCDEDYVLYFFSEADSGFYYLAMYRWADRALSVVAREEAAIDYPEIYKGRIYYTTDIAEAVSYKTWQDGAEQTAEEEDTVGVRLNRIALDGTGKETVFEYRYPEEAQEIRETRIPYLSLIYEISGDQIVAEVYIGNEPHPFYRMKTDGSGAKKIGQVPGEQE